LLDLDKSGWSQIYDLGHFRLTYLAVRVRISRHFVGDDPFGAFLDVIGQAEALDPLLWLCVLSFAGCSGDQLIDRFVFTVTALGM
jgi:hypothetical protein